MHFTQVIRERICGKIAESPLLDDPLLEVRRDVEALLESIPGRLALFNVSDFRCSFINSELGAYLNLESGWLSDFQQTQYFNAFDISNHFTFIEVLHRFLESPSADMSSSIMHTRPDGVGEMLTVYSFVLQRDARGAATHYASLFYPPTETKALVASTLYDLTKLTKKQRRYFSLLLGTDTREQIAAKMQVTPRTCDNACAAIYQTLGVQNRAELLQSCLTG